MTRELPPPGRLGQLPRGEVQRTRGSTGPSSPSPPQPCAAPRGIGRKGRWACGAPWRRVRARVRVRVREGWRRPPCQWGGHGAATVAPGECMGALAWLHSSLLYLTPLAWLASSLLYLTPLAWLASSLLYLTLLAWPAEEPVPAHALPPRPHLSSPPSPSARAHAACATTTPYPRTPRELRPDPELYSSCHRFHHMSYHPCPRVRRARARGDSCPHQGGRSTRLIRWGAARGLGLGLGLTLAFTLTLTLTLTLALTLTLTPNLTLTLTQP